MKKLLLFLAVVLTASTAWAGPVTESQARQKAADFLAKKLHSGSARGLKAAKAPLHQKDAGASGVQRYYVFNLGSRQGYVVVSGDDRTPAILGYADHGTFDAATMPSNMRAWLQGYERQIALLDHVRPVATTAADRPAVDPLLKTAWDQTGPYWNLCPIDPLTGDTCLTGCAATAMAQLMYYHQYPEKTTAIPAYYQLGTEYPAVDPTTIDWANILESYTPDATIQQQMAVARLMRLCGQAVRMEYASEGSGTYDALVFNALYEYFGYDKQMGYMQRYSFLTNDWNALVYDELAAGRPVLYFGTSVTGGHAFVVDGYDQDDYFHVNWGWGGECDGYFLLSILDPEVAGSSTATSMSFSMDQSMIVGIQKPQAEEQADRSLYLGYFDAFETAYIEKIVRQKTGFQVHFYVCCQNVSPVKHDYNLAFGIYDERDSLVEQANLTTARNVMPLDEDYFYYDGKRNIGKTLADGTYTIRPLCRLAGTKEWQSPVNQSAYNLKAVISQDTLTIENPFAYDITGSLACKTAVPTVGEDVEYEVTLHNSDILLNRELYLLVNGEWMGGRTFELGKEQTGTYTMSFKPKRSGTSIVQLTSQIGGRYVVYAADTVTVLGQEAPDIQFNFGVKDLRINGTLPHDLAQVSCYIHNNSRNAYDGKVRIELLRNFENQQNRLVAQQELTLQLAGDADTVQTVVFDHLDNEALYMIRGYFYDGGIELGDSTQLLQFITNIPADGREDMTYLIENADFEWGSYGWNVEAVSGGNVRVGGTGENYCFEAWNNREFNISQQLTGLPAGIYEIQVQGFYRYLRYQKAWNAWQKGGISVPVYVYLNNSATPLKNIFAEPAEVGTYSGMEGEYNSYNVFDGKYFPNDMVSTAEAFSNDMYRQSAFGLVMSDADTVSIGVRGATNQGGDSWAIWDNFRLVYLGFEPKYMVPALEKALDTADALSGQAMSQTAYNDLADAMEQAEQAMGGNDGELMFRVLGNLYAATDRAVASNAVFGEFSNRLDDLRWALENYHVAADDVQQVAASFYDTTLADMRGHKLEEDALDEIETRIDLYISLLRMPKGLTAATATSPVECTSLLDTPGFERDGENSISGWYGSGYLSYGNNDLQASALAIECYQNTLNLYQVLTRIPNGYYRMQASAFYRYGSLEEDATNYRQGMQPDNVCFYMQGGDSTVTKSVALMASGARSTSLGMGEEVVNLDNFYVPNDMVSAKAYFNEGRYTNSLLFNVTQEYLVLGIEKASVVAEDWLIMDDFRLFYYGTVKPTDEQLAARITDAKPAVATTQCYDLSGRRTTPGAKGLTLQRLRRPDGTVVVRKVVR